MAFEYPPIMAQNGAPKPPRVLFAPSKPAWYAIKKPLSRSRVALLTSAALRPAICIATGRPAAAARGKNELRAEMLHDH